MARASEAAKVSQEKVVARVLWIKVAGESAQAELLATSVFIAELHGDCAWLLKYADARKTARNHEIEGLGNAMAALSGADYSFVQTKTVTYLRH